MKAALAVGGLVLGLAGCVTTTTSTNGGPDRVQPAPTHRSDDKDRVTESDQTSSDRRAKLRLELAGAYFARGQPTDALDEVKQALAAKPDNSEAYGLRGLIYAALGDAATADESFQRALNLAPRDGQLMHNYGWFLCQQKRYQEADAEFTAAMAQPGYLAVARTQLAQGVCQARGGHLPQAERTLSHAYELDPANPVTAVNLSEVLYKNGEYERALFYVRRVNNKQELQSAQTLWLAARIERKLGQDAQVQDMGSQLHKNYPQSPETLLFEKGSFDE